MHESSVFLFVLKDVLEGASKNLKISCDKSIAPNVKSLVWVNRLFNDFYSLCSFFHHFVSSWNATVNVWAIIAVLGFGIEKMPKSRFDTRFIKSAVLAVVWEVWMVVAEDGCVLSRIACQSRLWL